MSDPERQKNTEKQPIEIERKFLVSALPENLDTFEHDRIRQGYLVIGSDGSEARLRDSNGEFTLTIKSKGDLSRGEWETSIDEAQFTLLWQATAGRRLEKTRYKIPYEESLIELDVYAGDLTGLISAEVEFSSEEAAEAFNMPDWFAVDVTSDKAFKNQNLALKGLPQ